MNKAEALRSFLAGKYHPHCPVCGNEQLFLNGRKQVRDSSGQITQVVLYVCARCTAPFNAWIDPHGEEKEETPATRETAAYEQADGLGDVEEERSVDDNV